MNSRLSCAALVLAAVPGAAQQPSKTPLTLAQTVPGRPGAATFFAGLPPFRWSADGQRLVARMGPRQVVLDPASGKPVDAAAVPDPQHALRLELRSALEVLPETRPAAEELADAAKPWSAEGFLVEHQHDLYVWRRGAAVKRLTKDGSEKRETEASPDGKTVAFVRDHNLVVVDIETGEPTQVTDDGNEELFYGRLDWVYQEEVYERGNFKGFWWSPTSAALAFYRLDESPVREFTVIDHVPDPTLRKQRSVAPEVENYPKAGDPNPVVTIGVSWPHEDRVVWLDTSQYATDILVVRVGWTPDGRRVVLQIQNRPQTWLDLVYADPQTGALTPVLKETSASWVNILGEPRWLPDGSFLWLSERSGYKHVYHYEADGKLRCQVTSGEWAVDDVVKVDAEQGLLWFSATKDGAINRHVYRIGLDGQNLHRLTVDDGTHDVDISPDGSQMIDRFSSLTVPPQLRLCDRDGKIVKILQESRVPAIDKHGYLPRELHVVKTRDGFAMDVAVLKPAPFDPSHKYPVFLDTYAGPNAPTVRNSWNAGADPLDQFMAQNGVIVLQANNRSASGKGQVFTAACYKNFGESELRDLEDAVAWLCQNPWADADRVAISGWSYGGTMAAYALTHSKKFALGLAGAGVYDWRLYDSIYTERYMDLPEANPQGYERSSCIAAAANLHGHLVLMHGTMDDNVHLQNLVHFVYALQEAGQDDFEVMLYPKSRHGVGDPDQNWHMRKLMWRAVQRHLKPGT